MQWIRHIIILGLLSALPFVQADADEDDKSINFFKGGAAKFEETIKGKVALVFLGMPWCGYCKQ